MKKKLIKNFGCGLLKLKKDKRDFIFGSVFGVSYQPRHDVFELPKTRILNQMPNTTCTFYSACGAKEQDEGLPLSPKSSVKMAKRLGLIKDRGLASLRTPQIILQKYGIVEENIVPDENKNDWNLYSQYDLTDEQIKNMETHKTQSFWLISNHIEAIKLLDEGRPFTFGVNWTIESDSAKAPNYILSFGGAKLGGHAMKGCGYDMNRSLIKVQNSFGERWGENGYCYIRFVDFDRFVGQYGAFVNLDFEKDVAKWLIVNSGKVIKEKNGNRCYFIEQGKKRLFEDEFVLWAYNFSIGSIENDEEDMLPQVPDGETFVFEYGQRAAGLKEIMRGMENGRTQELAKKYFPEFFR